MASISSSIPQSSPICLTDTTPPRDLGCSAWHGQITRAERKVDPLVIYLDGVELGATLEVLNRSANPAADWNEAKKLPIDTSTVSQNGALAVVLSDAKSEELGIKAGDILTFRQVDRAGNSSNQVTCALKVSVNLVVGDDGRWNRRLTFLIGAEALPAGTYALAANADARPPVVVPRNMKIVADLDQETATLTSNRGLELYAKITLTNGRTGESWYASVAADGQLALQFKAKAGDTLYLQATDHSGNSTDMGSMVYAPTCVVAGPACQTALRGHAVGAAPASG